MTTWGQVCGWVQGLGIAMAILAGTPLAMAEGGGGSYVFTGDGVRTKSIAFVHVKVYSIRHDMKDPPKAKSKQAVIDADVDKRFALRLLRSVDAEKMRDALASAYKLNGYTDEGKYKPFLAAMTHEVKEGSSVVFTYEAATKKTTITVQGDGTASALGPEFMKATWSIWLGKSDQPDLGEALISKLP